MSPQNSNAPPEERINDHKPEKGRRLYMETYGCQMNVSDSEVVVSIMQENGIAYTSEIDEADIILINTCSI